MICDPILLVLGSITLLAVGSAFGFIFGLSVGHPSPDPRPPRETHEFECQPWLRRTHKIRPNIQRPVGPRPISIHHLMRLHL